MSWKHLWTMGKTQELSRWRPEQHLAEASARHGLTVDAYRARIRDVVSEARANGPHLSLQIAQSRDFSDADAAHLETCALCARLIETIHATDVDIRRFDDALRQRTSTVRVEEPVAAVPLVIKHRRPRYAVPVAFGGGVLATGAFTFLVLPLTQLAGRSPSAIEANEPMGLAAQYSFPTERVVISGPELFKSAAYSEQTGQPELAKALVVAGFTSSDLDDAQRELVTNALQTMVAPVESDRRLAARGAEELRVGVQSDDTLPSAERFAVLSQLSFEAGQSDQGYRYLLAYLEAAGPNEEATWSFKQNFVDVAIGETAVPVTDVPRVVPAPTAESK